MDVCLKICEDDSLFIEANQIWNLFAYILKSPNNKIEKSTKYYQLLEKLSEKESGSKSIKIYSYFYQELLKNGILSDDYSQKNIRFSPKN